MANYQKYYDEEFGRLTAADDKQIAQRRQNDATAKAQYDQGVDAMAQTASGQYQQRIDEAPAVFQEQYDANHINELVNRKRVQESMANMGLTDSGLNRSQQTALAVQRGNADAATRQQQQAYVTAAQQAIDQIMAEAAAQKQQYGASVDQATNNWIDNLQTATRQTAANNANARVIADQEAETERIKAQQEAEAAAIKLQYGLIETLVKEGMSYEDAYRAVLGSPTQATPQVKDDTNVLSDTNKTNAPSTTQDSTNSIATGVNGVISGGYNSIKSWANQNLAAGLKNGTISKERAAEALYAQIVDTTGVAPYSKGKLSLTGPLPTSDDINNSENAMTSLWNTAYDLGIENEMAELCEVSLGSVPTRYTGGRTKSTTPTTTPTATSKKEDNGGLLGWLKGFFSDYSAK